MCITNSLLCHLASVLPRIYTIFTRPLIAKWRGEGKKVIMFFDDGFATADKFSNTLTLSDEIKQDLLDSGVVSNTDESIWEPVQNLKWLGVNLNLI